MDFKHTKGEWTHSDVMNFSDTLVAYISANDKEVAQTRGLTTGQEDECLANAKLMSNAPKMLLALIEISEAKGAYNEDRLLHAENTIKNLVEIANNAIKEAI